MNAMTCQASAYLYTLIRAGADVGPEMGAARATADRPVPELG